MLVVCAEDEKVKSLKFKLIQKISIKSRWLFRAAE